MNDESLRVSSAQTVIWEEEGEREVRFVLLVGSTQGDIRYQAFQPTFARLEYLPLQSIYLALDCL